MPIGQYDKHPCLSIINHRNPKEGISARAQLKLTDEQEAIANHIEGPALVFAVAGSGKTTCMVHRIKRLIEKHRIAPEKILATSFNNSAVQDIVSQLSALKVSSRVNCRTLHSVGYQLIRSAAERQYVPKEWLNNRNPDDAHSLLVAQTIIQMAMEDGVDSSELDIDREDLKNQISIWKGNLVYADLERTALPAHGAQFARQAQHEHELYVRAYRIYEKIRRQKKIITFDDMLMTGWEILARFPDILKAVQSRYDTVMVDEFQDVNFAQYRIMDLISQPHRNYMVIGDDDQCIYEWRGASPEFILNFKEVYQAKVFTISDNFRSTAQQVVPANKIISRNQNRYPKHLSLTKGFGGETSIHREENDLEVARSIVREIKRLIDDETVSPMDLVILIRLYSQTAFPETVLIENQIPYSIEGNQPFYKRNELVTLFKYLSFAEYEQDIRKNGFPKEKQKADKYLQMFAGIINTPRRYVAKDFVQSLTMQAKKQHRSAMEIMLTREDELKGRVKTRVTEFAKLMERLIRKLRGPAHKTLKWLIDEIEYKEHLLNISGIYEVGITKIQTVDALVEFAKTTKSKSRDFLDYIRDISINPVPNPKNLPPVKIMTIYKAKGLEWDTVFVPGCNEGLIPCAVAGEQDEDPLLVQDVEGERRLFYVAVTRAKKNLHLYYSAEKPLSTFLSETEAEKVLEEVQRIKEILFNERSLHRQKDLYRFCRNINDFHLERYFSQWAEEFPGRGDNLGKVLVENLEWKIIRAEKEYQKYREKLRKYEEKIHEHECRIKDLHTQVRREVIVVRKFKTAFFPVSPGDLLTFDLLKEEDVMVLSRQGLVGIIAFEQMPGIDKNVIAWEYCEAVAETISQTDGYIEAKFRSLLFVENHPIFSPPKITKPAELSPKVTQLLEPGFRKGLGVLKKLIG